MNVTMSKISFGKLLSECEGSGPDLTWQKNETRRWRRAENPYLNSHIMIDSDKIKLGDELTITNIETNKKFKSKLVGVFKDNDILGILVKPSGKRNTEIKGALTKIYDIKRFIP